MQEHVIGHRPQNDLGSSLGAETGDFQFTAASSGAPASARSRS
jgi:hypothetical protein